MKKKLGPIKIDDKVSAEQHISEDICNATNNTGHVWC